MISKNAQTILAIGGVVVVVGFLLRKQAASAVEAIANVNEGTPFEDTGPIGTLGNATNRVLFGIPQRFGEFLGETAFNLFGDKPDI